MSDIDDSLIEGALVVLVDARNGYEPVYLAADTPGREVWVRTAGSAIVFSTLKAAQKAALLARRRPGGASPMRSPAALSWSTARPSPRALTDAETAPTSWAHGPGRPQPIGMTNMSAFKDNLLAGKTAFIAGGTSGINLGIAKRYAELGAKVAVAGRNPEKAANAAAEIGHGALGLSCDVRDYAQIQAALQEAKDRLGPLDIVVSGAAGNFVAPALGMSANGFRTVVDIDLNGTFNVFRACYDLAEPPRRVPDRHHRRPGGEPLDDAGPCLRREGGHQPASPGARHGVGPSGVRVNGISPGPIAGTEGMARLSPTPESDKAITARIPLRRFGEVAEVAESAVFLVSDSARYVTGTILDCDGGSQLGDARDRDIGGGMS